MVLVGWHEDAAEHLHVESNQLAYWSGAQLQPVILKAIAVAEVAAALDSTATNETIPITRPRELCDAVLQDAPAHLVSTNGVRPTPVHADSHWQYEAPPHDVLVKVLGEISVVGRDITAPMDVEMLTLLACMRTVDRRPNIDTIDAMLGRDNAIKTLQSRMSRIRAKLGVGSDDLDLLPPAGTTSADPGRYHLSSRVLTDVDLIEHRYHAAQDLPATEAIEVLRAGLGLFAGPPFRGPRAGYSWAYPEGVISRITNVVNAYATLLMELAFDAEDIPLVLDAVNAAAAVLEDPIAQHPLRSVEKALAEQSCDSALAESVAEARRRVVEHVQREDELLDSEIAELSSTARPALLRREIWQRAPRQP